VSGSWKVKLFTGSLDVWRPFWRMKPRRRFAATGLVIMSFEKLLGKAQRAGPLLCLLGLLAPAIIVSAQAPPGTWVNRPIEEVREAAVKGDSQAQTALGNAYLTGNRVTKDPQEAIKWFRQAAEKKNAIAQLALGMLYDAGEGIPKDIVEAVRWYKLAAEQGVSEAQYNLGVCFARGEGVTADPAAAAKWFQRAALQGDVLAQYHYGLALREGRGVERDPVQAADWLRRAAYADDAGAKYSLGLMYRDGDGLVQSFTDATKWFKRAAEQGNLDGQYATGMAMLRGEGTEVDPRGAIEWLKKAADAGHQRSKARLGVATMNGEGVEANPEEGIKLIWSAAEAGDPGAQLQMAFACQIGKGIPENAEEAAKWLQRAASSGHSGAQKLLISGFAEAAKTAFRKPEEPTRPSPSTVTPQANPISATPVDPATPSVERLNSASASGGGSDPTRTDPQPIGKNPPVQTNLRSEQEPTQQMTPVAVREPAGSSLAVVTASAVSVIAILGVAVVLALKSRLQGLEFEVTAAKEELAKTNENLSRMIALVEQRQWVEMQMRRELPSMRSVRAIPAKASPATLGFKARRARPEKAEPEAGKPPTA
jgi:TPR repeat protein